MNATVPWNADEGTEFPGILWWMRLEGRYMLEVHLGPQGHGIGWLIVYDRELPGIPMKPEEVLSGGYRAGGTLRDEAIQEWIRAARRVIDASEHA